MASRHPGSRKLGAAERTPRRETKLPSTEAPAAVAVRASVEAKAVENGDATGDVRRRSVRHQKRPRADVDADGNDRPADVSGGVCKKSRDTAADADVAKRKSLRGGGGGGGGAADGRRDENDVGGAGRDVGEKRNGSGSSDSGGSDSSSAANTERVATPASVARDRNLPSGDSNSGAGRGASADGAADIGVALVDAVVDFFAGSTSLAARFVSGDTHTRGGLRRLLARKLAVCHARHTAAARDGDDDGEDEDDDTSDDDGSDRSAESAPDRDEGAKGGGGGGGTKKDFVASVVRRPQVAHRVFVGTSHGPYREFAVRGTDTVGALKARIALRDGVPVDRQHLVFRGRRLEDSKTLAEYRIGDGATVYIHGLSGGASFKLSVRTLDKTLTLEAVDSDTVLSLKRRIQTQAGHHVDNMRLVFGDRDLRDDYTLAEYRISSLDTIDLL